MLCIHDVFLKEYFSTSCTISSFGYVPSLKKSFTRNLLICWGVYITLTFIFNLSQVTGKWANYSHSFFSCWTLISKPFFPITSIFPEILSQKSKIIIKLGIFRQRLLYASWSFSIFFGSQGGSHDIVWHHMKFMSYYTLLFW